MSTPNSRDALADGNIPAWIASMAPDQYEVITVALPSGECVAMVATIGLTGIGYNPGSGLIAVHVHESETEALECFDAKVAGLRATRDSVAGMMGAIVASVPDYVPDTWS